MTEHHLARAFGLCWQADTPLSLFAAAPDDDGPIDVTVARVDILPPRAGGTAVNNGQVFADGIRFRFDGTTFDMTDGRQVRWLAPAGRDLPLAFYGTVTGLLLAWRGMVPLHGSAVALGDRTVLIAGRSGAGKSTLCHALVEQGGLLVSDDLSALLPMTGEDGPLLVPGRPAIRLIDPARADPEDKRLVVPPAIAQDRAVRLTDLVLLQDAAVSPGPAAATALLARQQFRPRWMGMLPGTAGRAGTLFLAAQRIAIHVLPPAPSAPDMTPVEKAALVGDLLTGQRAMDLARRDQ